MIPASTVSPESLEDELAKVVMPWQARLATEVVGATDGRVRAELVKIAEALQAFINALPFLRSRLELLIDNPSLVLATDANGSVTINTDKRLRATGHDPATFQQGSQARKRLVSIHRHEAGLLRHKAQKVSGLRVLCGSWDVADGKCLGFWPGPGK